MSDSVKFYATGRRKTSVAKVWIGPGLGRITVNNQALEDYFHRPLLLKLIQAPLAVTEKVTSVPTSTAVEAGWLRISGGG